MTCACGIARVASRPGTNGRQEAIMRMKCKNVGSLAFFLLFLPVFNTDLWGMEGEGDLVSLPKPKRYGISVEGDLWYTMWEGLGHGSLNFTDYDINSTLIYGLTLSGFYRTNSSTWFGVGLSYLSDFQQEKIEGAFGEDVQKATELINGLLLLNFGKNYHFYSRVLWGRFNGVLHANRPFGWSTDWLIADLLWIKPPVPAEPEQLKQGETSRKSASDLWFGLGFRMIRYDQPMEIISYNRQGKETDSLVVNVRHAAYCLYGKLLDSSHFGIPSHSWFYYDVGLGFGVAVDRGDGLEEDLYGFDFTFDVDVGLKYIWTFRRFAIGIRGGYRLLGDMFILAQWEVEEGEDNTSTTQINLFHGPFVSANVSF